MIGALLLCRQTGVDNKAICKGIAAALSFDLDEADRNLLNNMNTSQILKDIAGLEPTDREFEQIINLYNHKVSGS